MFKTTKAKIIFIAIYSFICLTITAMLILYQNIEIVEKEEIVQEISQEIKEKDVSGIDLSGTYNQNDLEIEEKVISQEKIEIRYFQIKGLKNKKIENKINKEIEYMALNGYKEKIKNIDQVTNLVVSMWESANFANMISFEMSYTAKVDVDEDIFIQGIKGINYDLTTGNKITIDQIFTSDAPIEEVLRKSVYYNFISCNIEENLAGDLIITDYGNIEDEITEIINLYKKGKITEFTFTPTHISIFYDEDKNFNIDMEKFAQYIAIYSRYISEHSLYENTDIGIKNIYTLSRRYNNLYYYTNYQNEDNYFIDITIDWQCANTDEFAKKLVQEKIVDIENEIEKVKKKVKESPNDFYVLNYFITIYTGEEWSTKQNLTVYNERGNSYEMTVHDFEENVETIIIDYARQEESGGIPDYVYDFTNMLKVEPQNTIEYYNPENGEKVVI